MAQAEVFSPAKINLFLAVTGRCADGFHELVSVVAPLAFGDDIGIEVSPGERRVVLTCSDSRLPTDEGNLAFRAAKLYLDEFGVDVSVSINLVKRIPFGAGLGGGSSNASAVLRGLNDLLGKASNADLLRLAAALGSDCPLFIEGKPLIMRGRGEKLDALPIEVLDRLRGKRLVVFKPNISISTPWAYKQLASDPDNYMDSNEAEERLGTFLVNGSMNTEKFVFNSFEAPIFNKMLGIVQMQTEVEQRFGVKMLMSGSGSSCFAFCDCTQVDDFRSLAIEAWGEQVFFEYTEIFF